MLSSRGLVRSLPSKGLRRHASNTKVSTSALQRLGDGQRFSTSRRSAAGLLRTNTSPLARNHIAAPIVLGGISASRSLSLWGYGWNSKPKEAQETPATAIDASQAVEKAPDAAAAASETAASMSSSAAEPVVAATDLDLSAISDIVNNNTDILNMTEEIGYLHAIGLDYGWGFTSVMQWALEHVHVWGDMGWGAAIMTTAVVLRAIMFYPQIRSLKFNAEMQAMRKDPRAKEAMKLVQQGFQNSDPQMRQKGQVLNKMLKEEYGVSNTGIIWSLAQIPFTFGLFRIVSGMTHVPVPSLETAGYWWFTDLTATDPYFILPAAGTAVMLGALVINARNSPPAQRKMMKTMAWIFGTVGFIGTTFLSAAVNLMTVALGASTLVTAVLLNNPAIRRVVGLPPLNTDEPASKPKVVPTTATYEAPRPIQERLNSSLTDMKKGFSEQITNYTGQYTGTDSEKAEKKRREMIRKLEDLRKEQEQDEFQKKYKSGR